MALATQHVLSLVMQQYFEELRILVRTGVIKDFEEYFASIAVQISKNDPLEAVLQSSIDSLLKMRAMTN